MHRECQLTHQVSLVPPSKRNLVKNRPANFAHVISPPHLFTATDKETKKVLTAKHRESLAISAWLLAPSLIGKNKILSVNLEPAKRLTRKQQTLIGARLVSASDTCKKGSYSPHFRFALPVFFNNIFSLLIKKSCHCGNYKHCVFHDLSGWICFSF